MREMAKKVGLGSYSRDLTADLCNLAAGGKVNPPSAYRETVERKVAESLPAPDANGRWSITVRENGKKTSQSTTNRQEAITARTGEAMRYHTNVCDFLQAVDLAKFPGSSPLEQAMSLLKLLAKKSGGQGGGEGGEPLPIFSEESAQPEGTAEALHDAMDTVDSLTQEEQDMLDPQGDSHDVQESPEGDGQRTGTKGLDRLKVAEDLVEGSNRVMLDISRQLDQFTKMQARRQRLVEPDPAGEEVRTRPIRHLGELQRVAKTAWATRQENPSYFIYQAVTGQLPVRERVTRIERKQAIFILVDGSGSMSGRKHWKATGVVMNRLKAVLSGDAEVWVSVFDTQLNRVHHASTPAEAREVIKKFAAGNFSGGGTDIAAAIRAAHAYIDKKIKAGEALYRPEVVVLTDEDSSVSSLRKNEVAGTRVHGFAMEVANPSLVEFARSTGGVGMDKF
jgi:Mg-chelatase subunit ChlD